MTWTASERWRVPLGPFNNLYGMGASPVLVGDVVVLVVRSEHRLVHPRRRPARRTRAMEDDAAARRTAGTRRRSSTRPPAARPQVVVPGSFLLTAYAVGHGEKIWWVRGLSLRAEVDAGRERRHALHQRLRHAARTSPARSRRSSRSTTSSGNTATPRGTVTLANLPNGNARSWIDLDANGAVSAGEWDYYRAAMASENGMLAIRLGGRGDMTEANVRWKLPQGRAAAALADHLSRRALHGERRRHRHRAESRARARRSARAGLKGAIDHYYASPVAADGKIFMLERERARSSCCRPAAAWSRMSVSDLGDDIYATPAISDGRIYLRTRGWLYCFGLMADC